MSGIRWCLLRFWMLKWLSGLRLWFFVGRCLGRLILFDLMLLLVWVEG